MFALINFTGNTGDIFATISGIFGSFGGIITILIAVPIAIFVIKFLIELAMDNYYDQKKTKAITESISVITKYGYAVPPPPTPQEVQLKKALETLKLYNVKVIKK